METKFTPGPWTLQAEKNNEYYTVFGADQFTVAIIDMGSISEMEANAKLIAAAPELLETLRQLLTTDYNDPDMLLRAQSDAQRAVNKALGR